MIIHQFTSETSDDRERGRELGAAFAPQVADSLEGYWRLFAAKKVPTALAIDHAHRTLDVVGAWAPHLLEEMLGLAEGAGIESWEAALMSARTEVAALAAPTGGGECSTGVHVPDDGSAPRTIQTWDWFMHLAAETLVWRYRTSAGREVHSFTEIGLLGKIGISNAGVGSHMNMLNHVSDGRGTGVPLHLIARRIHDEATSVEHAVDIARSAEVSASTVLTVVDYLDEVAHASFIELSPAGSAVIPIRPGETLVHTNHFLDPELARGNASAVMANTVDRLAALGSRSSAVAARSTHQRAIGIIEGLPDGGPVCVHEIVVNEPDLSWETKVTISLDFEDTQLEYHPGSPLDVREHTWTAF